MHWELPCDAAANTREVRRGNARRPAPRCCSRAHGEGSAHSCTGTDPTRALSPPTDPSCLLHGNGSALPAALPHAARGKRFPSSPREPSPFQLGEMPLAALFPSLLGRQTHLAAGAKAALGAGICCQHTLQPRSTAEKVCSSTSASWR